MKPVKPAYRFLFENRTAKIQLRDRWGILDAEIHVDHIKRASRNRFADITRLLAIHLEAPSPKEIPKGRRKKRS